MVAEGVGKVLHVPVVGGVDPSQHLPGRVAPSSSSCVAQGLPGHLGQDEDLAVQGEELQPGGLREGVERVVRALPLFRGQAEVAGPERSVVMNVPLNKSTYMLNYVTQLSYMAFYYLRNKHFFAFS